jgi:beta-glucosidase
MPQPDPAAVIFLFVFLTGAPVRSSPSKARSGVSANPLKLLAICLVSLGFSLSLPAQTKVPYLDPTQSLDVRVADLISRMTLAEKASQLYYAGSANSRLQIPAWAGWNQCIHGVWTTKSSTLYPIPIGLAATWDPDLVNQVADSISDEARALYSSHAGGPNGPAGLMYRSPVINISRNPFWGRIQECYGEDPWLTSRMGVAFVHGLQGTNSKFLKVAATLKHFAVNNVESGRTTLSASVPERWLYEYWLPHWKACATEGGAQSLMAAYNAINGTHCAINPLLLTQILRTDWGFRGFVTSDLGGIGNLTNASVDHLFTNAASADAAALSAGCDYDDAEYLNGIPPAVTNGLVSQAVLDQALARLLSVPFRLGVFDPPSAVPYTGISTNVIRSPAHLALTLKASQSALVLLKNANNFLPLNPTNLTSIALIGPQAANFRAGNYYGTPTSPVTPLQGFMNRLGTNTQILYAPGSGISTAVQSNLTAAMQAASNAQVVIMCLGTDSSIEAEGRDRTALELPAAQESLLESVYSANSNLVLVLLNAGPLAVPWAKANVPAILEAWYDGEQGGNAIADAVLGNINPGGKLPYTVYPASNDPLLPPQNQYDVSQGFTYMYYPGQALFPFGHGLSYTTFAYSNLQYSASASTPDTILTGSVDVQNTGNRSGDEVVQVYIHNAASSVVQAIRKLVAFKRITLAPGEVQNVHFSVSVDQLSYYDAVTNHAFVTDSGNYNLLVGSSSADIRASNTFNLSLPPVILPGAPVALSATAFGTNVELDWNKAPRANAYSVQRAFASAGPFSLLASGVTNTTFVDGSPSLVMTNYYIVTATNSAGESVPTPVVSAIIGPGTPASFTATASGSNVNLSWSPTGPASYIISRAASSVGPFIMVASGIAGTNYVDVITNSSLTYYYQLTAVNGGGQGSPASATVKLSQPLSFPWTETDVGAVGLAGAAGISDGTFTLQGAGASIFGTTDGFHFVYTNLTCDGTLIARVVDVMATSDIGDGWEKAGVMIRETLDPGSKHCMMMMTSGQGSSFHYRTATGGTTTRTTDAGLQCPFWIMLVRTGNVFTGFHSPNGYTWTQTGSPITNVMSASVFVGLALSAHNTNQLNTSHFDGFSVSVPGLNAPANLTATVLSETQATLGWIDTSSNETSYAVERSSDVANTWTILTATLPPHSTNYIDATLTPLTTNVYRVRVLNGGLASAYSPLAVAVTPAGVGDGIPGSWRLQFFGNGLGTNSQSCATCDPDSDHFNNLQEYLAGTSPLDSTSYLRIKSVAVTNAAVTITFTSAIARYYDLQRADNLNGGPWTNVATNFPGTGADLQITDPAGASQTKHFYRLVARP